MLWQTKGQFLIRFLLHPIWDYIEMFCEGYGLKHVDVIYRGIYDKDKIMQAFENKKKELAEQGQDIEGFVVRDANEFPTSEFQKHVAKFVRALAQATLTTNSLTH